MRTTRFFIVAIVFISIVYFGMERKVASTNVAVKAGRLPNWEEAWKLKSERRKSGYSKTEAPQIRAEIERQKRTPHGMSAPGYRPNQVMEEYQKALVNRRAARTENVYTFVERGPGTIAGRIRALLVDPDDPTHQTWFAGSASGGIWKTIDGGTTWQNSSTGIPNLGTNTLAMSLANTQVIYAGTGEHF
ncbi:MAG: hypothetical protein OEY56_14895, partial [Cyclobacteriaceae bacterium]|nr:hypothetical protein [Cyclobacteriaceae bacterium]